MRTKTVFSNDELPHIWAHQSQDSGRTPNRNLYFQGDTIYSYGSHFPIARHVTHKGRRFVFFTTRDYSVTTSGHKYRVRGAIPRDVVTVYVDNVHDTPKQALDSIRKGIQKLAKGFKGLNAVQREKLGAQIMQQIRRFNELAELFGYRSRLEGKAEWRELERAHALRKETREAKRLAREQWERENPTEASRQREKRREAREAKERAELAKHHAERLFALESWRMGGSRNGYNFGGLPVATRIVDNRIETSLGASIPLAHALRVLPIVKRILERGESYQRNGHSIHLGHYVIDSISEDGTLRAGCHVISRDELTRLIGQLEECEVTA